MKRRSLYASVAAVATVLAPGGVWINYVATVTQLSRTAEAIRADGHPDWFVLTGFIHDMGKVLCLFGEPQWAVVGDTFPVGCAYADSIVFKDFFAANPDSPAIWRAV